MAAVSVPAKKKTDLATNVSTNGTAKPLKKRVTIDGNEAAAWVAYKLNEVIAIYPITPSSPMGEWTDQWAAEKKPNLWGTVPIVQEMQAESGAAGAVHGALQAGSLATTFTSSQGLLLMIPNMYKIAGELTSTVFQIAARTVATQSLSIFGDHSDVMAARSTGWAILFAGSVQEVMDFSLISNMATLESRIPFMHVFDGMRTSHEIDKIEPLDEDDLRALIDEDLVRAHRGRRLNPDNPFVRGTSQNPDTFFQAREAANPYYMATPDIVQRAMDTFAERLGRQYHLFDYHGAPDAERVIVTLGSSGETVHETVDTLLARGEKVGVLKVRLFRPWSGDRLVAALPPTVRGIAVLDRTKEPGAAGEPLYVDVITSVAQAYSAGQAPFGAFPRIIGGRYGLSSKDFTPSMAKAVFDELTRETPKAHFTVGIEDDVTHLSLDVDPDFENDHDDLVEAVFWGLGSDGTVGANKSSIKIIGEDTPNYAQGYFYYDSKKAGTRTVSHLRFGPRQIRAPYLIRKARFVAIHQFDYLDRYDMLDGAAFGATVLLNSPFGKDEVWNHLPRRVQEEIIAKKLDLWVIDASGVAQSAGLGGRINTVMQTCFFAISKVLPREEAIARIKGAIKKNYGRRGEAVVRMNMDAVDSALDHLYKVAVPEMVSSTDRMWTVRHDAPEFVRRVTAAMILGEGDKLPVSAMPADGTYPSGTTQWEKRNLAYEVPVWEPDLCIQCGKCVMVCPHAVIRAKVYEPELLSNAPATFKSMPAKWRELGDQSYTLQIAVEDCTGCQLCVEVCPAKSKTEPDFKAINMRPQAPLRANEPANWDFFLTLPDTPESGISNSTVKDVQLRQPLFEFSGACAGCGETPYLKLMSQLFGDRAIIANATGCSSIFGGNLPTTPWSVNGEGRGPAWSNSLFEDNAEFGLGMRLTLDKQVDYARSLVNRLRRDLGEELAQSILDADQVNDAGIKAQRLRVEELKAKAKQLDSREARDLLSLADVLVRKGIWIVGGDGWAYDIGFGGLDHVMASGANVNILVLDTEVYSNTGGQASKATPMGAVAKFASGGMHRKKKDLGQIAMSYGNVYVAQVAMGASDSQTLKAFLEAEAYNGPSLIIAYSQCIAHGIDMAKGMHHQKMAVDSGHWPMYRFDPRSPGGKTMQLDSKAPSIPLREYLMTEDRYKVLMKGDQQVAEQLLDGAQEAVNDRWKTYLRIAGQD
jgi:pyruvate-ferredoxin/flavodoxin oxidoreductase